jgi:putative NADH-flavin reductase
MKVAHVGATGKVGSRIVIELLRRGHTVTAISRHPEKSPTHPNVRGRFGDVSDPEALALVIKGHDAVSSAT